MLESAPKNGRIFYLIFAQPSRGQIPDFPDFPDFPDYPDYPVFPGLRMSPKFLKIAT